MAKDDGLISIEGGGKKNVSAEALREMKRDLPNQIEFMGMMADLQWAKYEALKKKGFSEQQALELCRDVFAG